MRAACQREQEVLCHWVTIISILSLHFLEICWIKTHSPSQIHVSMAYRLTVCLCSSVIPVQVLHSLKKKKKYSFQSCSISVFSPSLLLCLCGYVALWFGKSSFCSECHGCLFTVLELKPSHWFPIWNLPAFLWLPLSFCLSCSLSFTIFHLSVPVWCFFSQCVCSIRKVLKPNSGERWVTHTHTHKKEERTCPIKFLLCSQCVCCNCVCVFGWDSS